MFGRISQVILKNSSKCTQFFYSTSTNQTPYQLLFQQLSEGHKHLKDGKNLTQAMSLFEKVSSLSSELYPTRPLNQCYWTSQVSICLASQGFLEESKKYYNHALALLRKSDETSESQYLIDSLIILGEVAHLHHDLEISEELLTKALKFSNSFNPLVHANVLVKLMAPKLQLLKVNEALEICQKVLSLLNNDPDHLILRCELYFKQAGCYFCIEDLENAKKSANLAIGISETIQNLTSLFISVSSHELIADCYLKEGLLEQAVQSALAGGRILNKNFPKERGIIYYNQFILKFSGHPITEELIDELSTLLGSINEENPELLTSLKLISGFYFNHGRIEDSLKYTEKILRIVKKTNNIAEKFEAYSNAARIYLSFDMKTAKTYVDLAQGLFDTYPDKLNEKFMSLLLFYYNVNANQFELAEKYILNCIENTSENVENIEELLRYFGELSDFYYTTMKSEKSIEHELKTLQILEKYEVERTDRALPALGRLASSYARIGNYEKALEHSFEAVEFIKKYFPDWILNYLFIYVTIMNVYSNMGEFSLALEQALEVLPLVESNPRPDEVYVSFYFELGNIYENLMNKIKAKEQYLKVKEMLVKLSGHEMMGLVDEKLANLKI